VRELGLDVRAGLHTGECEVLDGKVAGIAVHTARALPLRVRPASCSSRGRSRISSLGRGSISRSVASPR
jgi:hypothetical protein